MKHPSIVFNHHVKLILSDVDETAADLYIRATSEMIAALTNLLKQGKSIFFISGQGLTSIRWRIINHIPHEYRWRILVGYCSGAEVRGFDRKGNLKDKPFYSVYDKAMTDRQKQVWRECVEKIVKEFQLETYPTMPIPEFIRQTVGNPLSIMFEDRGPQITFEVPNGYMLTSEQQKELGKKVKRLGNVSDIRIPIFERAKELFRHHHLPITPRLGGMFAIDFAVEGTSKTTSVRHALENAHVLESVGLNLSELDDPKHIEIWGDKFSVVSGGTDRHMSEAVSPLVRSINFRQENPDEFLPVYNIVVWDGEKHLHEGLLEYLMNT